MKVFASLLQLTYFYVGHPSTCDTLKIGITQGSNIAYYIFPDDTSKYEIIHFLPPYYGVWGYEDYDIWPVPRTIYNGEIWVVNYGNIILGQCDGYESLNNFYWPLPDSMDLLFEAKTPYDGHPVGNGEILDIRTNGMIKSGCCPCKLGLG
jgi:hypothetical protein